MKNLITFEKLVGLSSLFIASCAAVFSIIGIGMLFSGSSIAAMIMASSLEIGKLVATSFLYRYWRKSQFFLKSYLISAVLILMVITSAGIFGYLTGAYQQSALEMKISNQKIEVIESQKKYSQDKIDASKKRIENIISLRNSQESRLNESMTNSLIARNPIQLRQIQQQTADFIEQSQKDIESENSKIQKGIDELQSFDKQITDLRIQNGSKKDVQTFQFIADEFGVQLNKVVKWFIISLISVFDPLAVCLLLAYNTALYQKNDESQKIIVESTPREVEVPVEKEVIKEVIKEVEVPVEKEVIKEVIKEVEVPVEKEVIKEVIKEVSPSSDGLKGYFSF
jgi:hypothetical protein